MAYGNNVRKTETDKIIESTGVDDAPEDVVSSVKGLGAKVGRQIQDDTKDALTKMRDTSDTAIKSSSKGIQKQKSKEGNTETNASKLKGFVSSWLTPMMEDETENTSPDQGSLYTSSESLYDVDTNIAESRKKSVKERSFVVSETGRDFKLDIQEALGLTSAQASGFAANISYESGNFKTMQEDSPKKGRGGYGYAQWTGSRRKNFESWAKKNNLNINSYEANLGFVIHEIQNTSEGRFLEALEATTTPEEAAIVVSNKYLRPKESTANLAERISRANIFNEGE